MKNCLFAGRGYSTLINAKSACSSDGKCIGISFQKDDTQVTGLYFRICYDGIYVSAFSCMFKKIHDTDGTYKVD